MTPTAAVAPDGPAIGELVRNLPLPDAAWQDRHLAAGELLFRAGESGDVVFVVADGEIEVFVEDQGGAHVSLALLGPGQYLGELALLDGGVRTASAIATRPSYLRAMSRDVFLEQLTTSPVLAGALIRPLSDRLRNVLGYVEHLISFSHEVAEGRYGNAQSNIQQQVASSSGDAARFYQSFADMLAAVQQREAELKRELDELRILIDRQKQRDEVKQVTDSDEFQRLVQDARRMRARHAKGGGG